ncbi:MAG: hypothetical protein ACI9W4_002792 [Rhodothermales bacterium]|jgi:hypothetical protein
MKNAEVSIRYHHSPSTETTQNQTGGDGEADRRLIELTLGDLDEALTIQYTDLGAGDLICGGNTTPKDRQASEEPSVTSGQYRQLVKSAPAGALSAIRSKICGR